MEENSHPRNGAGKRVYSSDFRQQVVDEVVSGETPASVSRKHGIPIQNIHRWSRIARKASQGALVSGEEMVPLSELKKSQDEIKQLRQALGKMALERDILRDAVDLAAKKKWI